MPHTLHTLSRNGYTPSTQNPQSVGSAYEKYGAKGLNDVCIAAISLFSLFLSDVEQGVAREGSCRESIPTFAWRRLSYPMRKCQIYHRHCRTLFVLYD